MTNKQIGGFLEKLKGPKGCNFRGSFDYPIWDCSGDFSRSLNILNNMGISDKESIDFLEECEELGGYCDCEIIINAAERLKGAEDAKGKNIPKV